MEQGKTTRHEKHVNIGQNLELKFIDACGSTSASEMNRYLKTNSTVQPGNTANIPSPSKRRSFRASLRSESSLDQTLVSFRDVDAIKKIYHRRARLLAGLSYGLGLLAVILAIIDIEVTRRWREKNNSEGEEKLHLQDDPLRLTGVILKGCLSLVSVITCIVIYKIYMNTRRLFVIRNLYHETESFITSNLFPKFWAECVVCLFHVPPFVDDLNVPYVYKFQLLVLLRLYLATRFLRERSELFHNQATNLLASVTKTDISSSFLVKTYFLKEPFKLIFTFYTLNVFLGGYCVYVIEESHSYLVSLKHS